MAGLWLKHAPLRRAALAQGLLSVAFSAFWSTLALVLAVPEFGHGSAVAGGLADRRGPQAVIRVGALLVFLAFAVQAVVPASLWLLLAVAVVFDLGAQAALVSHQSVVYALDTASRSRLNAVLVSVMFGISALGRRRAAAT